MKILVLGASGMLGNAMLRVMSAQEKWSVFGTVRGADPELHMAAPFAVQIPGVHADQPDSLLAAFAQARPDLVINCVGLVKQLSNAEDPLVAVPINTLLPHRLARMCEVAGARLVHVSTDCVFSGMQGSYIESDLPDAQDVYGRSKLLGEVDYPHAVTLRTSIIGHELRSKHGLVDWFLSQHGRVKGYTEAVFSGLPTCELARVVRDFVIPHANLHGVYHVAAEPISKFDLLQLVNRVYGKALEIEPDDRVKIYRSLNADRFREVTGYVAPSWPELVARMHDFG
jgi:dTDP-4-dehydrorhamnose reductase